jgi:PBP1b-binding outer membrane lipoprotein LpoB
LNIKVLSIFLLSALFVTGCGKSEPFSALVDGPCSLSQTQEINDHISSQIGFLTQKDFEKAYTYAADSFQENISLNQFEEIINKEYSMLVENTGFSFSACEVLKNQVLQEVLVESGTEEFLFYYVLVIENSELGVLSASFQPAAKDVTI